MAGMFLMLFVSAEESKVHFFAPAWGRFTLEDNCPGIANILHAGFSTMNLVAPAANTMKSTRMLKLQVDKKILSLIEDLPDNDVVMMADMDIVWMGKDLTHEVIRRYHANFDGKMVFHAEANCWHIHHRDRTKKWLQARFPNYPINYSKVKGQSHYLFCWHPLYGRPKDPNVRTRFLNSGMKMGSVAAMKKVLTEFMEFLETENVDFCLDDQCVWQAFYVGRDDIALDFGNEFVFSGVHQTKGETFEVQNGKIHGLEDGSNPLGYHGNGQVGSKSKQLYKTLLRNLNADEVIPDADFTYHGKNYSMRDVCENIKVPEERRHDPYRDPYYRIHDEF